MTVFYNKQETLDKRRALRNDMPRAEHLLWARLRGQQINGVRFRRQYGIENYITDFYCVAARVAIELDGESHSEDTEDYDRSRQRAIEQHGVTVLRFSNIQVYEDLDSVVEAIAIAVLDKCQE